MTQQQKAGTYRATPFQVEAIQFTGDNHHEVIAWADEQMGGDAPPMDEHDSTIRIAWRPDRPGLVLTPGDWFVLGGMSSYTVIYAEEFGQLFSPAGKTPEDWTDLRNWSPTGWGHWPIIREAHLNPTEKLARIRFCSDRVLEAEGTPHLQAGWLRSLALNAKELADDLASS